MPLKKNVYLFVNLRIGKHFYVGVIIFIFIKSIHKQYEETYKINRR